MNKKQWLGLGLVAVAAFGLAACGNRSSRNAASSSSDVKTKAAIVTDTGGVDDKSFNQSAWEGLQAWGKEHNLEKDKGYTYFQSTSEADYANNLQQAAGNYNLIYGIGFALKNAVADAVSATFADNEAAYLAGVAAAKTTKTKQVGFVGGMESEVISRFAAGFKAGVESVDPSIKVQVDYAGSFGDAAKGKTIAAAQYAAGADVIYQAAGGTGAGVFSEAKSLNESKNESEKVWVIGVDRDQVEEGKYTSKDGKEANFVLASTLKQVGTAVKDLANKAEKGEFPGGQVIVYSLKDKGVDLAMTNLSEEGKKAVEDAKAKILDGSIKVPEK